MYSCLIVPLLNNVQSRWRYRMGNSLSASALSRSRASCLHQPPTGSFRMFDRLLVPRQGGQSAYPGDVGKRNSTFIERFESHRLVPVICKSIQRSGLWTWPTAITMHQLGKYKKYRREERSRKQNPENEGKLALESGRTKLMSRDASSLKAAVLVHSPISQSLLGNSAHIYSKALLSTLTLR